MNMYTKNRCWTLGLALVFSLMLVPAAGAQDYDPWEINADVDNDGVVGPTDIQHVINSALGITDRGPDAVDRPLRHYIVASPRASLAPVPGTAGEADCDVVGAATNFARPDGRLLVRKDTAIAFRFDRSVEGVWHDDACGLLRAELLVEIQRLPAPTAGEPPALDENAWRPVGRDGAAGRGCGPAIGTANIAVRHLFEREGDFVVRSTVRSFAIPEREVVAEGERPNFCGATRAVDKVLTYVRVVGRRANADDLRWQTDDDPETVGRRFGTRLQNSEESDVELP